MCVRKIYHKGIQFYYSFLFFNWKALIRTVKIDFQDMEYKDKAIYVFSYYDKEDYFLDYITELTMLFKDTRELSSEIKISSSLT